MITPPFSISARPLLTRIVPMSLMRGSVRSARDRAADAWRRPALRERGVARPRLFEPRLGWADRRRPAGAEVQPLVAERRDRATEERPGVVNPGMAPLAAQIRARPADQLRAERPGGVDGGPRERAEAEDVEGDREADREAGDRLERPALVGRRREDDPDEEEGADRLADEAGAGPDDRVRQPRRAEVRWRDRLRRVDPPEQERCDDRAAELDDPVPDGEHRVHALRDEEAERDRGVEVAAGDVADRRDHDRDH